MEILYEKNFPKKNWEEATELHNTVEQELTDIPDEKRADEFLTGLKITPIFQRMYVRDRFIQQAKEISERYQLDIRIRQFDYSIVVDLSFPNGGDLMCLKHLLEQVDECMLLSEKTQGATQVMLTYYTHTVTRDHRLIAPKLSPKWFD